MADNTANEGLWLPEDIWANIASFLDNDDLAKFRQLCSTTQFVGSNVVVLQPLYNRLYALDNTLPPMLPQKDTLAAFKQAFEKIHAQQQLEITYLKQHHPEKVAASEKVFQNNTNVSLQSLEATSVALDKINSAIIKKKIKLHRTFLNLSNLCITRLPVTLFLEPDYTHFWQNLTCLTCDDNQLTTLNVQKLAALKTLRCNKNQLITLNVQGLKALEELTCGINQLTVLEVQGLEALKLLYCSNNKLTTLNLQTLSKLQSLWCDKNPLKTLILTGVHANTKGKYAELEKKLLFNKLSKAQSSQARQAIISRLGPDYTPANCFKYCPIFPATLLTFNFANSAYSFASSTLSQASAFLPFFGATNTGLKRKRDEDEIDIEELSEEAENQPALKKRKKK